MEFLLQQEIERRVKTEIGAKQYFVETVLLRIDSPKFRLNCEGSIYFLSSKELNVPTTSRLIIQSPDNLFATSQQDFKQLSMQSLNSFRNNLQIVLQNYGAVFIPYTVEFLKVTPSNT